MALQLPNINQMRFRNLLSDSQTPSPNLPYGPTGNMTAPGMGTGMDPFAPDTTFRDRLMQVLGEMPLRENYQPTGMDKLRSALLTVGSGGPAGMWGGIPVGYKANPNALGIQQALLDQPYDRAVDDFNTKLKPIEVGANLESEANKEKRLFEYQSEGRKIQQGQLDRQTKRDEELARSAESRENMQSLRFGLDKWKAENPNGRVVAVRGGNVVLVNPQTGQITDTGVDSGTMTDVDRMNMQVENANNLEELRQGNRLEAIAASGAESRATRQTPTAAQSETAESPTARRARLVNKAMDIINQNPAMSEFFQLDTMGRPTGIMTERPGPSGIPFVNRGTDKDEHTLYDEARKLFLGESPTNQPTPSINQPTNELPEPPAGKVLMIDPNGNPGYVPIEQEEAAILKGYARVKRSN
jgi:hypothetical protein